MYHLVAPNCAPRVEVISRGEMDLTIRWNDTNCMGVNGFITGYIICYGNDTFSGAVFIDNVLTMTYNIEGLSRGKNYSIEVAAVDGARIGVYSMPIIGTTLAPTGMNKCTH